MTWTYADPAASYKDAVRFALGDTDGDEPQLTDEEVNYLLSSEGGVATPTAAPSSRSTVLRVAHAGCLALVAKYGRQTDFSVPGYSESASRRAEFYADLAEKLRVEALKFGITLMVGVRSIAEKQALESDSDRVQPLFKRGMHDAPGTAKGGTPDTMWTPVYPRP